MKKLKNLMIGLFFIFCVAYAVTLFAADAYTNCPEGVPEFVYVEGYFCVSIEGQFAACYTYHDPIPPPPAANGYWIMEFCDPTDYTPEDIEEMYSPPPPPE